MEAFLDNFFSGVVNVISTILTAIVGFLFQNTVTTIITGFFFMNGLGFYLMYHDKKLAVYNGKVKEEHKDATEKELKKLLRSRISELTLMLIALIGGSLGVLGGMYKFNHKTQKPKFKYGVPAIIVLQIILIIWRIVLAIIQANNPAV